ncbi:MAG: signal peptidase II [Vicinamibacterales bacterium]
MSRLAPYRLELAAAAVVVVLDQATKAVVRGRLALHESVEVVGGVLDLTRVHNSGAAFGMLNGVDFAMKPLVMGAVALVAMAGIVWYMGQLPREDRLARLGMAAIVGGAVGNLIDRVQYGYVLDFVDAYWAGWHFWAFNVADAAITVGVGLIILDMLGLGRRRASNSV